MVPLIWARTDLSLTIAKRQLSRIAISVISSNQHEIAGSMRKILSIKINSLKIPWPYLSLRNLCHTVEVESEDVFNRHSTVQSICKLFFLFYVSNISHSTERHKKMS